MRDKLKKMELRLTELSKYLDISRPTLYKFVEYYESGIFDLINENVKYVFDYITTNNNCTKRDVISFISNELSKVETDPFIKEINTSIIDKTTKELILCIIHNKEYYYLYDTILALLKGGHDPNNIRDDVGHILLLMDKLNNNKKLTAKDKDKIKKIEGETIYGKIFSIK